MDPAHLSDDQLDDLADEIAPRLPTGTHGDHVILPRRAFIAGAAGTLSAGALMALGVDEAAAQAAGRQGTPSEPNDMYAYDLNVANEVTSALPMGGHDIENAGTISTEKISSELAPGQDVLSDRSVGSPIQNTTGTDLMGFVRPEILNAGENGGIIAYINDTTSGLTAANNRIDRAISIGDYNNAVGAVQIRVPDGYYYQIDPVGDVASASLWNQRELSAP